MYVCIYVYVYKGDEGVWIVEQLHVELRESQTSDKQIQIPKKCAAEEPKSGGYKQGLVETWV